jgi:hypothetical protein
MAGLEGTLPVCLARLPAHRIDMRKVSGDAANQTRQIPRLGSPSETSRSSAFACFAGHMGWRVDCDGVESFCDFSLFSNTMRASAVSTRSRCNE